MPPRKKKAAAAAAATPPFTGFNIAISGSFPGRTQASIETDFIVALGGTLAKSVSPSTTYLVTTEADWKKPSMKVKSAEANGIPIVSFQWLEDCLAQNTHVKEDAYVFLRQQQAQANGSAEVNSTRKRSASQTIQNDDGENQPPQPKKGKADNEFREKEREPKIAEGQIAKSFDVKIPVDEGARLELANHEVYIDDSGVIYDASLNQTNAGRNNNKFYRVQASLPSYPRHLYLLFRLTARSAFTLCCRRLPHLDAMGSRRRIWPIQNHR